MLSVVLDTNVLVAALIKRGGPNREALRLLVGHSDLFEVCYSSQMMAEYEDVLGRPVVTGRGLAPNARRLIYLLKRTGSEVVPKTVPAISYPDPDDRPFLEAAVYVNGVLITNNLKDYPFLGVPIMGPESFLDWWASRNRNEAGAEERASG